MVYAQLLLSKLTNPRAAWLAKSHYPFPGIWTGCPRGFEETYNVQNGTEVLSIIT